MTGQHLRRALMLFALLVVGLMWGLGAQQNPRLAPGAKLGELTAELANGERFSLSEHRGEVVVLNFWATWCLPCRKEAPVLSGLYKGGVKVVGLAIDPLPMPAIADKARELGMNYPVGLGTNALTDRLGIRAVPTTCVIGKDGTVVETLSGLASHDELTAAIASAQKR